MSLRCCCWLQLVAQAAMATAPAAYFFTQTRRGPAGARSSADASIQYALQLLEGVPARADKVPLIRSPPPGQWPSLSKPGWDQPSRHAVFGTRGLTIILWQEAATWSSMLLSFRKALGPGFHGGWHNADCSWLEPCGKSLLGLRVESGPARQALRGAWKFEHPALFW